MESSETLKIAYYEAKAALNLGSPISIYEDKSNIYAIFIAPTGIHPSITVKLEMSAEEKVFTDDSGQPTGETIRIDARVGYDWIVYNMETKKWEGR